MKKIVTKYNKKKPVQFVVKTNRLFGFIPWFWHTDYFYLQSEEKDIVWKRKAIFDTQAEAKLYIEKNIRYIDYDERIHNWPSFPNPLIQIIFNK